MKSHSSSLQKHGCFSIRITVLTGEVILDSKDRLLSKVMLKDLRIYFPVAPNKALAFHSLLSKVRVCVRVPQQQQQMQHVEKSCFCMTQNDIHFLCRCSACLGGCGETASQTEGARRGPHAGETLPAEDCPAEPPVPSYTQLTASSAEAPGEGTARA